MTFVLLFIETILRTIIYDQWFCYYVIQIFWSIPALKNFEKIFSIL